jgi:hypothetical protein
MKAKQKVDAMYDRAIERMDKVLDMCHNRTNYFVLAHIGSSQQKTFKIRAIDKADVVFKMWANHKISEVSIKNIVEAPSDIQKNIFWGI